jgi:hypothetical protein
MLDILKQKLQEAAEKDIWNSDDSNNPDILVSPLKDIVIEWTDTGYFQYQKEKVMFNDCTEGHTYILRKADLEMLRCDWTKFQELYIDSATNKLFRVDAPIRREEVEFQDDVWEYARFARPGRGVGEMTNYHLAHPINAIRFLDEIVDPYYYIIKSTIEVAKNNLTPQGTTTGYISPLAIPDISIRHALKDPRGYYFAKNFDLWNHSPENVITSCIDLAQIIIRNVIRDTAPGFIEDWTERATTKWMSLL